MQQLVVHGIYRHYKGDYYIIEDIARHTETGEELVIYRGLYANGPLWARPKAMFLEKIEPNQIPPDQPQQQHRFEFQHIKSAAKH